MGDDHWFAPSHRQAPRVARPSEVLFEFVRPSDHAPMTCQLQFHGESYGWEARFLVRGELWYAHGGFAKRAEAILWAEGERTVIEGEEPASC